MQNKYVKLFGMDNSNNDIVEKAKENKDNKRMIEKKRIENGDMSILFKNNKRYQYNVINVTIENKVNLPIYYDTMLGTQNMIEIRNAFAKYGAVQIKNILSPLECQLLAKYFADAIRREFPKTISSYDYSLTRSVFNSDRLGFFWLTGLTLIFLCLWYVFHGLKKLFWCEQCVFYMCICVCIVCVFKFVRLTHCVMCLRVCANFCWRAVCDWWLVFCVCVSICVCV